MVTRRHLTIAAQRGPASRPGGRGARNPRTIMPADASISAISASVPFLPGHPHPRRDARTKSPTPTSCWLRDYHALPNSQRYLASLIQNPAIHRRPVVLGVETIFSRDQHIVDEWWRGEIDEAELRERIRFEFDWGYDWIPFYELLTAARDSRVGLYGLDCMPREDLRKIGARDRHAADKIAEIRTAPSGCAGARAVWRVAPGAGASAGADQGTSTRERACLPCLQNVDALYWRAAGEPTDHVEAVQGRRRCPLRLQRDPAGKIRELPPLPQPLGTQRTWCDRSRSYRLQPD